MRSSLSHELVLLVFLGAGVGAGACATGRQDADAQIGDDDDDDDDDGGPPPDAADQPDADPGDRVQVTLSASGPGSVSISPPGSACGAGCTEYDTGVQVTITATPDGEAMVLAWSAPCEPVGAGTSCSFILESDVDLEVTFAESFVPTTFSFTGAQQTYTVPGGATALHVVADGASGGDTGIYTGGRGAHVDSIVPVSAGQVLTIVVGQQPAINGAGSDGCGASGGGGTFVAMGSTALVVAGGGGGAAGYSVYAGNGNPASLIANGASSGVLSGGSGGNGGAALSYEGGGGGGLLTPGGSATSDIAQGGQAFINGAAGGARASSEACGTIAGGFGGGGGGGNDMGGGGGGYSGGAAQDGSSSTYKAGGGGSFALGTPTITVRPDAGHGSVTITPM